MGIYKQLTRLYNIMRKQLFYPLPLDLCRPCFRLQLCSWREMVVKISLVW